MKVKFPCKNCPKKEIGCHAICSEYISAQKANEELREKIYKIKNATRRY